MDRYTFRGKRTDMGEWIKGSLITDKNGDCWIFNMNFNPKGVMIKVDGDTVGQATGLFDKNGTLIWEHDIVEFTIFDHEQTDTQYKGTIDWCETGFVFNFINKDDYYVLESMCFDSESDIEVLGNRFDTPELKGV